jgi:hypothetical protein
LNLIDTIIGFPAALDPIYQDLVTDILVVMTKSTIDKDNSDVLQTNSFLRYLSNALKSDNKKIRQNSIEAIFNLCSDPKGIDSLGFSGLLPQLFKMALNGEENEINSACKVLSIVLNMESPATPSNLDEILLFFFGILSQEMSQSDGEMKNYVLSCLMGFASNVECCKMITAFPNAFQIILMCACNDKKPSYSETSDVVIAFLCCVIKTDSSCLAILAAFPQFFDTVMRTLTGSIKAASLALECLGILSRASPEYCSSLRRVQDFWVILLLFLDDRNIALTNNDRYVYDGLLIEVLELVNLFALLDGNYRGITVQRHSATIIARLFLHGNRNIRREGLKLAYKCCFENLQFSKTLGSESVFVSKLIDVITLPDLSVAPLDTADTLLVLKVLTLISRIEQHCLRIGHAKGFLFSLLQTLRLRHSSQQEGAKELFQRAASSDSCRHGAGAAAVQELYEIQASTSLRHFCSKRPTAEFVLRLPFPVLETLLAASTSSSEADREDALEVLLFMASGGDQALMIMGLHGENIFRTLAAVLRGYPQQRSQVLGLIAGLVVTQSLGRALVDSHEMIGALSILIAADDASVASPAALIFESVARVDRSYSIALGQMPVLTDALVRSSLRMQADVCSDLDLAAAAAAEAAIIELSRQNGSNIGLFRRLKEKFTALGFRA